MTLKTYEKYSPIVSDLIDDIKSRQHDFKNHINTIYGIIQTTNEKDLKYQLENYITSLNKSLTVLDENISIDHKVVAAIIYVKTNIAKTENINFIYNIDCSLNDIPLQDYELSEILNNLLDNSFKAVKNEAYNNRTVKLKIDSSTTDYLIETENNGLVLEPNKAAKIFNKGFTTKKSVNHGYGLYNVKKIVEFYNGRIQLNIEDSWIKISLYIPR
ncbi:GHKL domain-containing protein [Clostridium pasteurianum]|uniref:sensor histidine kinase n=1 Tax=Clostridium pasteurianum TaxID=1501 RepID=UPI0022609DDA|nr:GHKL domain-containing protein [Clostridium pasteurianum]UZW14500.1 GHKL domain-containing protein [Clostridium pasteurianum]